MTAGQTVSPSDISPFAELLQGTANASTPLGKVVHYISESGGKAFSNLLDLHNGTDGKVEIYGSYLSRLLLEVATTAVIGRLDPFRLLVLAQVQQMPSHEIGRPNSTSIRWQGDVFGDVKVEWSQDRKLELFTRALLGDCWDKFGWQHALEVFIDNSNAINHQSEWVEKICAFEPGKLVPLLRTNLGILYSSLSKGIHLEFVSPPQEKFDLQTLSVTIQDVIFWCTTLLTLSNFVDHAAYRLSPQRALTLLCAIEKEQKGENA